MIKISMGTNDKLDEAFDQLCKFTNLLGQKFEVTYYEMYGLLECLKIELQKAMEREEDEQS